MSIRDFGIRDNGIRDIGYSGKWIFGKLAFGHLSANGLSDLERYMAKWQPSSQPWITLIKLIICLLKKLV